ncbi:MAG TPA: C4-type zinc ribbon domain-containing protein [Mycobacteriales bacterium]|nr:C4-type zinc ribbon domain-containing protein [Mycobacteriales bacterium]
MKAASADQLRLLDVQALDSTIDRLAHRRTSLPELGQIETLQTRDGEIADDIVRAETEDSDLGREQARVDADVELVRGRLDRDQKRLDDGQVGSPRELENLQSEIGSLHKRQSDLEDAELEVMEQREAIEGRLKALRAEQERVTTSLAAAKVQRDATWSEVDADSEKATAQRAELIATLPDDLVARYEKLRASSGGVGAAALHRGRCEGCHLQLNTTDLNHLRDAPDDEVLRCEECRRILIRTDESGL